MPGARSHLDASTYIHVTGIVSFLMIYIFLLQDITLGQMYAFGDFPPYYGDRAIEKFLSVWHFHGLGYSYAYNTTPLYLGIVTAIAGVYAQNVFYLSLIPLGFFTFLVFGRRFVNRLPALYLSAGFYALNPVTIGEFVNGSFAALVGFVGLPLVLHYLYRVVEDDSWAPTVAAGAVFGATTISLWLAFWMVSPFAAYLAYRARQTPRTLMKLIVAGLIGIVLTLPNIHHTFQRAGGLDDGQPILVDSLQWNYAAADLLAVLRMAGNQGMRGMNHLGYNTEPVMVVGLIVPGIALFALHRRRLRVFYGIIGSIAIFMVLTKHGVTYPYFELIPPLYSLRNPVKLQYPMLLSLSVCFGAGVAELLGGIRLNEGRVVVPEVSSLRSGGTRGYAHFRPGFDDETRRSVAIIALALLVLVAYVAPASGALGLIEVQDDEYTVPEGYEAVGDRLDGRILWVPYGLLTQERLRYTYPDHVGIKSGGVLHGIQGTAYVRSLFDGFSTDPAAAHAQLAQLGVQHVVVEKNPPARFARGQPRMVQKWGAPWLWGNPETFQTRLQRAAGYERVFSTDEYVIYNVEGVEATKDVERLQGLHRVFASREGSQVETYGSDLLQNGAFDAGTDGWWTWDGETGTQTTVVTDEQGEQSVKLTTESGKIYPIAQQVETQPGTPYQIQVDAEGEGSVTLFWYDGDQTSENLVGRDKYHPDESPVTVTAESSTLSLRIRPNDTELTVREASIKRSTYPPSTGFTANAVGVPGVVVDGRNTDLEVGKTVAVNPTPRVEAAIDPDVVLVDAETVLTGTLLRDESYRQGVAVLVSADDRPAEIPDDAHIVSHDHPDGTAIDYWVTGSFDDTPVTVRYTAYDERWNGPPGSTHFRAFGWANGYTDASPQEVEPPENGTRSAVIRIWIVSWLLAIVAIVGLQLAHLLEKTREKRRRL